MSVLENQNSDTFQWQSRTTFIVVMIGVTLSMKDFLVFPLMAAKHGGGAYILLYAVFLFLMGLPLLMSELLIGRQIKQPFFDNISNKFQCSRHWHWIVSLSIVASVLVLSAYNVIASWSLSFFFKTAVGVFDDASKTTINSLLSSFQADPERMMLWHTLFVISLLLMSAQGVKIGLQRILMVIVPMMALLLLAGLIYAINYGDYFKSVEYLLAPDFSKIDVSVALIAMKHAFYTLSVGLGIFLIFGSKMPSSIPIVYSGVIIVLIDLIFSIFTGLAINSFVFTLDSLPNIDDELAFSLLPMIFSQLPYGQFFGSLFYLLLTIAAITTAIALLEVFVCFLKQKYHLSRIRASIYASVFTWFIGLIAIFSYTIWVDSGFSIELYLAGDAYRLVNDAGFHDVVIYMASHVLQPLIALLMIIFMAWIVRKEELALLLNIQSKNTFDVVYFVFRYVTPTLVIIVWLSALGVLSNA
jgi:NSS family neurotransmitter:Na+ symporter